mmetsp:Transcript_12969/g.34458  ORF Transcript_12969/g.34458 Transcript_12969/m.34458 type:complete len:201 (-) Transcript_12969:641-1243(-)
MSSSSRSRSSRASAATGSLQPPSSSSSASAATGALQPSSSSSAASAADPKASANALSRLSSSSWTTATLPPPAGFGGAGFDAGFGVGFGLEEAEAPLARRLRRASTAARTPAKAGSPRSAFTALLASSGRRSTASAGMPMDRSAASSCESSKLSSSSFKAAVISFDASSTSPSLTQASRISPKAAPSRTPRSFSPAVGSA